jgi:hypothetical protein
MSESANARWVRRILEERAYPFYPPLRLSQVNTNSRADLRRWRWVALDRRGLEVACSKVPISELKRYPAVVGAWPGYGPMELRPQG